ncbi:MAG: tetratricopeptide repeat protein [Actinobacteria bacterium]|nr:tetratricopeptide repeat protein [Actinomycetota bacterium]
MTDALVYDLYEQGRRRLRRGQPRAAVEVLELAVAREPAKASLQETLGRAYFASAQVERARAAFARTVELDPTDDYANFGLGRCLERLGRNADAAKYLKLACALAERPEYRRALARVRARLRP